jgi:hypothetical protein
MLEYGSVQFSEAELSLQSNLVKPSYRLLFNGKQENIPSPKQLRVLPNRKDPFGYISASSSDKKQISVCPRLLRKLPVNEFSGSFNSELSSSHFLTLFWAVRNGSSVFDLKDESMDITNVSLLSGCSSIEEGIMESPER